MVAAFLCGGEVDESGRLGHPGFVSCWDLGIVAQDGREMGWGVGFLLSRGSSPS